MNIVTKYIAYLKDNPQGYWFKRKLFGWGWTPATWQGWIAIAIFLVFVFIRATQVAEVSASGQPMTEDLSWLCVQLAVAITLLVALCYWKGESPKWSWGFHDHI